MKADNAKSALVTAAMIVAAIRLWMQVRGKTKTPFIEWAIGWGALFFILSLVAEASPAAATSLAFIVVVSDFLKNGVSLTKDISSVVSGSESGNVFVATPFASTSTANVSQSKSTRENANPQTFKGSNF